MGIIVIFIIRNVKEKKFRTTLILLSIVLSIALFFASNSISSSFSNTILNQLKGNYGSANIVISSDKVAKKPWVSENIIKKDGRIKNYMGVNITGASYELPLEKINFTLYGSELDNLLKFNTLEILSQEELKPFSGKKIIISEAFANEYKFSVGDSLKLKIRNKNHLFKIVAISKTSFLFGDESQRKMSVVPKGVVDNLLGSDGRSSEIYLETKPNVNVADFVVDYQKELDKYEVLVKEAVSPADIQSRTSNISVPFQMISILVIIMSVFIIYTSFKVITVERLPILGTFRSLGATAKMTRRVLLIESAIYGFLGGMIGIPLGIGALSLILKIFSLINPRGLAIKMDISFSNIILSFLLSFVISLISAFIPILKASKIPLKDLVLGTVEIKKTRNTKRLVISLIILIIAVLLPFIVPVSLTVSIGGVSFLIVVISMLYSTPLMVKIFTKIIEKPFIKFFKSEGFIAIKNFKNNDNINQNVSLLIISISTLLLVSILSTTLQEVVTNAFLGSKYEVSTLGQGIDKRFLSRVKELRSVDKIYPTYQVQNVEIKNSKDKLRSIEGVKGISALEFSEIPLVNGNIESIIEKIQEDRYILLSDSAIKKLNAIEGDTVVLKTKKGDKPYIIKGIMKLSRAEGIIGEKFIKSDFKLSEYSFIAVKSNDSAKAVEEIKDLYGDKTNFTTTIPDLVNRVKSVFSVLFGILKGFSFVLLIIGNFGVVNNLIINFIQKKRAIAMLRAIGLSKNQFRKITLLEAFTAGIYGGVLGIVTTLLELVILSKILSVLLGVVPIEYPILLFVGSFLTGITVTLLGSVVPSYKGKKLNIIEAIKFE